MNPQRKGRLQLVLLILMFALPVAAVVGLHWADWRPTGKSYGELVQPPKQLSFPTLSQAGHQPFEPQAWQGKWHMVYVSSKVCNQACLEQLHTMRQLHASLAKEIDRMQRVWVIAGQPSQDEMAALQKAYPDLIILPQAAALAEQFDLPGKLAAESGRLYLVDPLGHLMMSYPPNTDPYSIRKDLMRLLTYSWAG